MTHNIPPTIEELTQKPVELLPDLSTLSEKDRRWKIFPFRKESPTRAMIDLFQAQHRAYEAALAAIRPYIDASPCTDRKWLDHPLRRIQPAMKEIDALIVDLSLAEYDRAEKEATEAYEAARLVQAQEVQP